VKSHGLFPLQSSPLASKPYRQSFRPRFAGGQIGDQLFHPIGGSRDIRNDEVEGTNQRPQVLAGEMALAIEQRAQRRSGRSRHAPDEDRRHGKLGRV
jgi:hypothetical protein